LSVGGLLFGRPEAFKDVSDLKSERRLQCSGFPPAHVVQVEVDKPVENVKGEARRRISELIGRIEHPGRNHGSGVKRRVREPKVGISLCGKAQWLSLDLWRHILHAEQEIEQIERVFAGVRIINFDALELQPAGLGDSFMADGAETKAPGLYAFAAAA